MSRFTTCLLAATLALPALTIPRIAEAQDDTAISAEIGATGLAATEARLAAMGDPTATERFALGGVRFLLGVEHALQTRYATDIQGDLAEMSGLPVLRLPLPPNPDATPFEPRSVADLFEGIARDMDLALATLDTVGPETEVGLVIDTGDLWFDVNANGLRETGEGVLELSGVLLAPQWEDPVPAAPITVRFDTADAAWLRAYAHLILGVSDVVLSVDPTEAIARVIEARTEMAARAPLPQSPDAFFSTQSIADAVDVFAMFAFALDGQPDAALMRSAHANFLGMIEENRVFWTLVARETDDAMEWIPGKAQQSALPIPFPPDLGQRWQAVLADAERLLTGELLLPVWRMGDGTGVNLARLMQDPPSLEVIGLLQGTALLPYLEDGPLIDGTSLAQFEQMVGGNAGLYMVVLN